MDRAGPQFGGAIGLGLFLAQALSVPFYVLGFANALVRAFPALDPWLALIAVGSALALFAVNWVSAELAIRSQYMVILAHLLTRNWAWRGSTIRVLRIVTDAAGHDPSNAAMRKLIQAARIRAEPHVVVSGDAFPEVLKAHSADADVVFMGIHADEHGSAVEMYHQTCQAIDGLPTTILVHSTGEADLLA